MENIHPFPRRHSPGASAAVSADVPKPDRCGLSLVDYRNVAPGQPWGPPATYLDRRRYYAGSVATLRRQRLAREERERIMRRAVAWKRIGFVVCAFSASIVVAALIAAFCAVLP
jgi:hypothetical protein